MKDPEILVQVDDSMPIGELLTENQDPNISIKRSAHVGNMFGADLILASLGMNMLLVDANYGERDKLYYPQFKVDEEKALEQIACPRTLSLANTTYAGQPLNSVSIASLADAFGNTSVVSDSQFVGNNGAIVEQIISTLLPQYSSQFTRSVASNGIPQEVIRLPKTIDDILLLGDDKSTGAIIPNVMNILIDFVTEAINYQTSFITHISGPTMVSYISEIMPLMNAMYEKLVNSSLNLPNILTVRLVPAAGVRFVVAASQAEDMDELLSLQAEYVQVLSDVSVAKKTLATSNVKATKSQFDQIVVPQKTIQEAIKRKLGSLPQLFYVASPVSNTPSYTSQYSALRNGADGIPGAGLYIPARVIERPISQITAEFKQLEQVRKLR
jgi:hypothetical protein